MKCCSTITEFSVEVRFRFLSFSKEPFLSPYKKMIYEKATRLNSTSLDLNFFLFSNHRITPQFVFQLPKEDRSKNSLDTPLFNTYEGIKKLPKK